MSEVPAFEVRYPDSDRPTVKIFASGRTEGLEPGVVVNRIPRLVMMAINEGTRIEATPEAGSADHASKRI